MAKPIKDIVIKVLDQWITLYYLDDISNIILIEGVEAVYDKSYLSRGMYVVYVNPLYDSNEIAQEIKNMLLGKVPDVFKDE